MTMAAQGCTNPAAGVIVASPAMAPTQAPTRVGLPLCTHSMTIHANSAHDALISVLIAAYAATPSAASALPALNPNHPNQSIPVPSATNGMLCGSVSSSTSIFLRCGMAITAASAEKPALMCTTMPPAKSHTPHTARKPPPHTLWQNGKYTRCTHAVMNTRYGPNIMRSANAPVINAGAMTANIPWKPAKASPGIPPLCSAPLASREPCMAWSSMLDSMAYVLGLPMSFPDSPKHREKPQTIQIMVTRPMETKFCMMIVRTFCCRTRPP
mmetsp:Transcript_12939/g.42810  ORF Transcript_12939/g.42810 Transcript_12939/m.42810 type:complete len:269 (+) Transcript_12939:634-1440(+)